MCGDDALYFAGPQINKLLAVSTKDGSVLWEHPYNNFQLVLRDDGLYGISGPWRNNVSKKFDPLTGEVLAELPAGDFDFSQKATESVRLEKGSIEITEVASLIETSDDWPTFRKDNKGRMTTNAVISNNGHRIWRYAPNNVETPATDILGHAHYPAPTALVTADGFVFYSGSDGIVRALDAVTGNLLWNAYTGGAVRFPPTVWKGSVLVGSGDGWVYSFEARTGRLLWRFRAAPVERKIPVYGSLQSTWPAASGVLVDNGTAYVAAGIVNYDGTRQLLNNSVAGQRFTGYRAPIWGKLDISNEPLWEYNCDGSVALAVCKNAVVVADKSEIVVLNLDDGKMLWSQPLEYPPVAWGLAVSRDGRIIVTLEDGSVQCFGGEPTGPIPFVSSNNTYFVGSAQVVLACNMKGAEIRYTLDDSEPTQNSKLYINDEELIDNDGGHTVIEKSGKIALKAGEYPILIKYLCICGFAAQGYNNFF